MSRKAHQKLIQIDLLQHFTESVDSLTVFVFGSDAAHTLIPVWGWFFAQLYLFAVLIAVFSHLSSTLIKKFQTIGVS